MTSGLARVVEKALSKSPDKRYSSAEEMLSALKALEVSSQSSASRILAAALAKKRKRTSRWIGVPALACVLLAGLAVWWWPFHGREFVLGPDWFQPASYTQVTHRGDIKLAALSPDGKHIAYTTAHDGQEQLHWLNLQTGESFDWAAYAGATWGVTFSPDSSAVFATVHDQREWGRLYKATPFVSDLTFVLDDVDGPVAFSPDSSQFAFRRRFEEKRANQEAIIVARTSDTSAQHNVLEKYNTGVGTRVAWSSAGDLAVNLYEPDLGGEVKSMVLLFSPQGKDIAQYSNPRFRSLSGPAWLDEGSALIFTGLGQGDDETQPAVVELARHKGQFRSFTGPVLTTNSMTVSRDFKSIAAVKSTRKSALWISDARHLDVPENWATDPSLSSFAWNSADSIVYASSRGGNVALWETKGAHNSAPLPQENDCASRQPAAVPGSPLLVFSSNCDASANSANLWLLNQSNGSLAKLTDHSHSDQSAAVAPDGDTVLYNSWPDNYPALMKISLRSRVKTQLGILQARNAAISPDGNHVACQVRENYDGRWRLAVLSMRDGTIEKDNLPLPVQLRSIIQWSPDGESLDYVDPRDPTNIWRYPLEGRPAAPLTHLSGDQITDFAWSRNGARLAWISSDIKQDVIIFHRGDK